MRELELEARVGELGAASVGGLEAQIERLAIEAEQHGGDERRVGHGRAARHAIAAGALPVVEAVAADAVGRMKLHGARHGGVGGRGCCAATGSSSSRGGGRPSAR